MNRGMSGSFRIFAMLREDVHQGVVWLRAAGAPARGIVKITNEANGKSVHCEAMQIDDNFLDAYNQGRRFHIGDDPSLVIGYWHREKLGSIATRSNASLTMRPANGLWGKLMACLDHPQTVVRVATWLGFLGLALGVVSLFISLAPLFWPSKAGSDKSASAALPKSQLSEVLLYAELKDGAVSGKVFNRLPDTVLTRVTVELVPKDEKNPFNAFGPRFVEIPVVAQPRSMSPAFVAETGALDPSFHTLRVAEAEGRKR